MIEVSKFEKHEFPSGYVEVFARGEYRGYIIAVEEPHKENTTEVGIDLRFAEELRELREDMGCDWGEFKKVVDEVTGLFLTPAPQGLWESSDMFYIETEIEIHNDKVWINPKPLDEVIEKRAEWLQVIKTRLRMEDIGIRDEATEEAKMKSVIKKLIVSEEEAGKLFDGEINKLLRECPHCGEIAVIIEASWPDDRDDEVDEIMHEIGPPTFCKCSNCGGFIVVGAF